MTERDPRLPVPDRSGRQPQEDAHRTFFPEIDTGQTYTILNDGRPALVEEWFDIDCRLFCRTAFYSARAIEDWSDRRHFSYLDENGLLAGRVYPGEDVGLQRFSDDSGHDMWSATVVLRRDDDSEF